MDERLDQILAHLPYKVGAPARPFFAKEHVKQSDPKAWNTTTVEIFRGDEKIGEYERNYPRFGDTTFEPFEQDGRWYALYSSDYTCTRIMSLPDCRDIGGEDPASDGFCPVEIYVPRYRPFAGYLHGKPYEHWYFESEVEKQINATHDGAYRPSGSWCCLQTGFVAGCIWGDDSSWKLQAFDLSQARSGKIVRDERFGHLEIAAGLPLAAAVQLHRYEGLRFRVFREEQRDLETGKRIDPYTDEFVD